MANLVRHRISKLPIRSGIKSVRDRFGSEPDPDVAHPGRHQFLTWPLRSGIPRMHLRVIVFKLISWFFLVFLGFLGFPLVFPWFFLVSGTLFLVSGTLFLVSGTP